jgi:hypothetical protein
MLIGRGVSPLDVEGFRAVSKRVQRRPAGFLRGQPESKLGHVDDARELRPTPAGLHPPLLVENTEARRPFGSRVGRRDGDDGQPRCGRDRLAGVDSTAASDREDAVGVVRFLDRRLDDPSRSVRLHAEEPSRGRQPQIAPALARHEQGPFDAELRQERPKLGESPANLYETRSFAKARNASAARVIERPRARTR